MTRTSRANHAFKIFAPVFAFFVPGFQFQDIGPLFAVKIGKIPAFRRILQDLLKFGAVFGRGKFLGKIPTRGSQAVFFRSSMAALWMEVYSAQKSFSGDSFQMRSYSVALGAPASLVARAASRNDPGLLQERAIVKGRTTPPEGRACAEAALASPVQLPAVSRSPASF